MKPNIRDCLALALLVCTGAEVQAKGNAVNGQLVYQTRCMACHSMQYNGVGPAHQGIFGRKAGSVAGYAYSPALQASGVVWDERTLERWLANPEKLVPGQKMGVSVPSAAERADLIAYLKRESAAH